MNLLSKLGWLEKLFLLVAAGQALALIFGRRADIGTFPLIVLGLLLVVRHGKRAMRRLVWRVRNRLIVTYVFIAVVPISLLLFLVGIALWMLIGQVAVFTVYNEYKRVGSTPSGELSEPTPDLLAGLAPQLGDVVVLDPRQEIRVGGQSARGLGFRGRRLPAPVNRFDIEVAGFTLVSIGGNRYVLAVTTRPSAVFRSLFGISLEGQEIYIYFASAVGILLLVAQLVSIVIGVSITRTLTGAVHDLYEATQRVRAADFSHRIQVKGSDQLAELSTSFNQMTENLERLIVVAKEKERLESELEIARHVQSGLFPKAPPRPRTLTIAGVCRPARVVSGDYYDYLTVGDSKVALAIGDIAGKGISAALLMASMQSLLRSQLAEVHDVSPRLLVSVLNRQLYANTTPEKYATFCLGIYDDSSGVLTYTNAGHLQPLVVHGEEASLLDVTGTVVGAFPMILYEEKQVTLARGDLLVAYTDGITEPENSYGEMFGMERLRDVVLKYRDADLGEVIARAMEASREWATCPEQEDDMTMVLARRVA
ncbi:MAG: PP2C family protein-serine/threonine phosphatase [Bryobacteraceae bacterium]